jgi:hypothetical protein
MVSGSYLEKQSFSGFDFPAENGIQTYDIANPMPLFIKEYKNENWLNYSMFPKVWGPRFENNDGRVMSKRFSMCHLIDRTRSLGV